MDKLTSIRIKYNDGTYLDQIPIGVLVQNVGYDSSHNLLQVLGTIDVDSDGTIQAQINKLFNEKVNSSDLDDYVNNQISTNVTQWLAANVTPTGSAVMVDQSLSISGAAADSKTVGEEIGVLSAALNTASKTPVFNRTVEGVRRFSFNGLNISAGKYYFKCDNISTSGTDADTSLIAFYDSNGNNILYLQMNRNVQINELFVLTKDAKQIIFYAEDNNARSNNDTFKYENVVIAELVVDDTLTKSGSPADSKAVGDKILLSENSILKKINVDSQSFLINTLVAVENANNYTYLKFGGTRFSETQSLYIRGRKHKTIAIANYPDLLETSPSGISNCFKVPFSKSLIYDFDDDALKIVSDSYVNSNSFLIAYISSGGYLYTNNRYYIDYKTDKLDPYYVPYFFANHLSAKINKINTDLNGNKTSGTYGIDTESFVFITDVHWSSNKKHSPGMIKEILKKTPVSTVICGGDLIQSYNPTKTGAIEEVRDFVDTITQIPCYEYYAVFGNHDSNANSNSDISTQFSRQEQYDMLYTPFASRKNVHWIWEEEDGVYQDQQTTLKNDYYFDHARTRTRYLCIDWTNPLNGNRASWVSSVLAKDDGYRVVIIYHGIYSGSGGELSPEHTGIMTLIEPYKSKIVALFTGHAHMDAVIDYYGDGSVPVILTSCDTFHADRMTEGTLDEQCFDVAVIDYTSNLIKLTRIGRGDDRQVNISFS